MLVVVSDPFVVLHVYTPSVLVVNFPISSLPSGRSVPAEIEGCCHTVIAWYGQERTIDSLFGGNEIVCSLYTWKLSG